MSRVYVGNLPQDIRQRDVEDLFFKFGRIVEIDLKIPSRPPAFAFVTFESWKDAEDAVKGRDGVEYEGSRLRVEVIRDGSGSRGGGRERGRGDERGREPIRSGGYRGGADSDWAGGSSGMGGGGGYAERGYGDRGYSERGYGDRGYAGSDRGYDRGFPQRGYGDGGYHADRFERGYGGGRGSERIDTNRPYDRASFADRGRFPPRGGGFAPRGGGRGGGGGGGGGGKRTEHRIEISGLPLSASWQDLKDIFRQVGEVVYSDVDKKGGAIVEFTTARDQDAAIAKFDNTQWKNPRSYIAETSVITIRKPPKADSPEEEKDDRDGTDGNGKRRRKGGGSRSPPSASSRSRSRSQPPRAGGKSRSRSRSDAKN